MPIVLNGTTGITTPNVSTDTSTLGPLTQALNLGSTGQIVFPATQNPSTNANTLDDYEEGAFTPTVSGGVTSPNYARQVGAYTKIGNLVQFQISLITGGSGSLNGSALIIGGLPFVIASLEGGVGFTYAYVNSGFLNSTTTNLFTIYGDATTSSLSFYQTNGASVAGTNLVSAEFRVDITGTYRT